MGIHGRFGVRSWLSMLFGLALFAVGGLPLLNLFGVIDFTIPALPNLVLRIMFLVAGALLLWDASYEVYNNKGFMWMSLIFGLPILVLGLIPVLFDYGVIGFSLDFMPQLVSDILTAIAGVILFFDAWKSE
jgi:hypothetical protein